MDPLQAILIVGLVVASLAWLAISLHVVVVQRRRTRARDIVAAAVQALQQNDTRALSPAERLARLSPLLDRASRPLVMRAAVEADASGTVFDGLAAYLLQRWGLDPLVADASAHHSARDKWRRMAALRILFRLEHPGIVTLLDRAVAEGDADVASVALSLLGESNDPAAVDVMLGALRLQEHPASRIAVHLEHSPQQYSARLRPLLHDHDPLMRMWSAALLGRYTDADGLEAELLPLTEDADPRVRKAAIVSLGKVGDRLAAAVAVRLLTDREPFVRAHAARALGELNRSDLAREVTTLLSDRDWWVRRAAKDALEMMGTDVWPVLVRCLDHPDAFVRNGAAEVFQNLGILDNLIVMEAVSDNPSAAKLEMLRRITAAGGGRLTDALIERAGPAVRPRIRNLLATIGLQRVAAC